MIDPCIRRNNYFFCISLTFVDNYYVNCINKIYLFISDIIFFEHSKSQTYIHVHTNNNNINTVCGILLLVSYSYVNKKKQNDGGTGETERTQIK